MKHRHVTSGVRDDNVAPHVGAWIETFVPGYARQDAVASPPTWGRGLKRVVAQAGTDYWRVAPHVGAWIETQCD